jgi:PiT family inorganic phosphate transporter
LIVCEIYHIKSKIWAFLFITSGICLGLLILGARVIETIGGNIIHLDLPKAICAQYSVGIASTLGSILGIPLSTSHSILGALIGIHLAQKIPFVHAIYTHNGEEAKKVNLYTIFKVVGWCLLTIPGAFGLSWVLTKIFV